MDNVHIVSSVRSETCCKKIKQITKKKKKIRLTLSHVLSSFFCRFPLQNYIYLFVVIFYVVCFISFGRVIKTVCVHKASYLQSKTQLKKPYREN